MLKVKPFGHTTEGQASEKTTAGGGDSGGL